MPLTSTTESTPQKRVAVYLRVSSAGQEENSSLDTQQEQCLAYAADMGWTVVQIFREVHSGADLFERPQLSRLRDLVRDRGVDIVLAYALDRVSRSQVHLGFLLSEWEHAGVQLDLVTEDFADSPEGRLLQSVRGFVAEMERLKIKERTSRGLRARVDSGKPLVGCRPPYGYRWSDATKSRLVIDPERAPVVKRIFAMALAGTSLRAMARTLTLEGIPTATGRSAIWEPTTIYRLLTHPVYAGQTAAYRYRRVRLQGKSPKVTLRPDDEQTVLTNVVHDAFITPDEQLAILTRLELNKRRSSRSNKTPEDTLLRAGFIRCGYCGSPLSVKRYPGTNRSCAYRCVGIAADRYGCPGFAIAAPILDSVVWARISEVLQDPEVISREVARLGSAAAVDADLESLDRRIGDLGKKQARLARLAAAMDDEQAATPLLSELSFLSEQRNYLTTERTTVLARAEAHRQSANNLLGLQEWCARVAHNIALMTYEQKRQVLDALHVDVRVYRADHVPRWTLAMDLPVDDSSIHLVITPEAA